MHFVKIQKNSSILKGISEAEPKVKPSGFAFIQRSKAPRARLGRARAVVSLTPFNPSFYFSGIISKAIPFIW